MKPDLLILTNNFPNYPLTSESWLADELPFSHSFFNKIFILPETNSNSYIPLPDNCSVLQLQKETRLSLKETLNCFSIVLSDLFAYPSKTDYFKNFRNNLALIKNLSLKAKAISNLNSIFNAPPIVYAYWADNLLTTACILKQQYKPCYIVSRAHGFEVFEEQTKHKVIPFRTFQSQFSTKIFADSKNGRDHLIKKDPSSKLFAHSYVGTLDHGLAVFNESKEFTIVTCSHIRNVKRLHLMAEILQHISFSLTWNLIGTGTDLELVRSNNSKLPKNITVNYLGNFSNNEVLEYYKKNHINLLVSLSYSEGLPVSMMEAQSFGIPIMSTDVGGCSEICNDNTGFLIPKEFDGKEVAKKIEEFKNSEKNAIIFRDKCRAHWQKYFNAETNYTHFSKEIAALKCCTLK